jgi:hypothetical protein
MKAKEAEYTRQKAKLIKIEDQIKKTTILAPCDGLVVYATSAKGGLASMMKEPLTEGQQVFERQELIYMPTDTSTMAEVGIHETSLAKVRIGQPAIVTVETLPGKRFFGTVGIVAPLPDSTNMFLNPDLKVFNTQVYIDTEAAELRSGMTCNVEIIVEKYDDAVYVPLQAVTRVAGDAIVHVREENSFVPRKVEIGLDNNLMIRIISGLKEGEVVLLDPPLKSSAAETVPTGSAEPNDVTQKSDAIDQQVNDRLNASRKTGLDGTIPAPKGAGPQTMPQKQTQGMPTLQPGQMPPGMQNLTPEQQKKMKEGMQKAMELMKNMSEEEKEKLKNMTMEERIKFFQEKLGTGQEK